MPCTLTTRQLASGMVIQVVESETGASGTSETTALGITGLGLDTFAKRNLFPHVAIAAQKAGCKLDDIGPDDFEAANTIGDLVDLVWQDLQ